MSRKHLYKQIFTIIYIALIKYIIDEKLYITTLQEMISHGFKTYHINDFIYLALYLKTKKFINASNISILIYVRDIQYNKLYNIACKFHTIRSVFLDNRIRMIDRVHVIQQIIRNYLHLMHSFSKIDKLENHITDHEIIKNWLVDAQNNIIERLQILCNTHFTIRQLQYLDVHIISYHDAVNMQYQELEKYYCDCIHMIKNKLNQGIESCNQYIECELNYINWCHNINK